MKITQRIIQIILIILASIVVFISVASIFNIINFDTKNIIMLLGIVQLFGGLNQFDLSKKKFREKNKVVGIFSIITGLFIILICFL